MPRKKLTVPDMMAQPYYMSILTLTNEFQGSDEYYGLEQIHYRYALQKNPKMPDHYKRKMKNFFGKELRELFEQSDDFEKRGLPRRIFRDCIPKGSHLSFYLKNLVDIKLLESVENSDGKKGYVTYFINDIYPTQEVFKNIDEKISPTALSPIYWGDPDIKIGNADWEKGVFFRPYFIGIPEEIFTPRGELIKEFEKAHQKLEDGIIAFGEFLRKNVKPNVDYPDKYPYEKTFSHKFGLYLELDLLSDIGIKAFKKEHKRYEEEQRKK